MISQSYEPLGYQQVAATSSAKTLTPPAGANLAVMRAETANIRWRDDGTAPTASVGFSMNSTDTFLLEYSGELSIFQFIAQSGSPLLNVVYYKAVG